MSGHSPASAPAQPWSRSPKMAVTAPLVEFGCQAVDDHRVRSTKRCHHVLLGRDPLRVRVGDEHGWLDDRHIRGERALLLVPLAKAAVEHTNAVVAVVG